MRGYEQNNQAFQEIVAPEVKTLLMEMRSPDGKIDSLRAGILSEARRLDTRLDSLERELKLGIEIRERLAALEAKVL